MMIALAGKSTSVREIEAVLNASGLDCIRADNPEAVKDLPEQIPILLLCESALDPFLQNDTYASNAMVSLNAHDPIVFLLDHVSDTPDYVLRLVLRRAHTVAVGKRPVYILARSIRSGLPETEKLYIDARNVGVTFIKYEEVILRYLDRSCQIEINDNLIHIKMDTPLLIDCSLQKDKEWMNFAKVLRLHTYGNDLINADRWFLYPGRTSRRGVFFIDTGVVLSGILHDCVVSIANEVKRFTDAPTERYAYVDPKKCAFCYTCYRICPHGAPMPDSAAPAMKVDAFTCDGCGMCASICPAKAITMRDDKPLPSVSDTPEKLERKSSQENAIAFCCENSAAIAAKFAFQHTNIRMIPIPCGGSLDAERITEALREFDRVLVAVCADDACRHFDGNRRACLLTEKVKQSLEKLGLDPHRIKFLQISHAMPAVLKNTVDALLSDGG